MNLDDPPTADHLERFFATTPPELLGEVSWKQVWKTYQDDSTNPLLRCLIFVAASRLRSLLAPPAKTDEEDLGQLEQVLYVLCEQTAATWSAWVKDLEA